VPSQEVHTPASNRATHPVGDGDPAARASHANRVLATIRAAATGVPIVRVALLGALVAFPVSVGGWDLTVDAPPSLAGAASRLEGVDPEALDAVLRRAGLTLPTVVRVTLIAEESPVARATPAWIVARAFGSGNVLILPGRVASYPYDSLESVFRHEVAHLALSARAGGRPLPRWFHEGVAVSIETGWGVADSVRLLLAAAAGPAIADLTRLFQSEERPHTAEAYRLATALVEDLRRRHGAAVPGAIAARVAGGVPFARAFALETGETPDQASAEAWATYRTLATWLPFLTSGTAVWALILALAFVAYVFRLRQRARRRDQWDGEDGR